MQAIELEGQELVPADAEESIEAVSNKDAASQPPASICSGILNLANTIIGSGLLSLPSAFARCGFVAGSLLLLIFAAFSALGLHLLSAASDISGRPASLYTVAEKAQPNLGLLVDVAIGIKCFGVATTYLIVVGDSLPLALEPLGVTGALLDRRLWSALAALAVAPLAYRKRIDGLRYTSLVAILSVLVIMAVVIAFAVGPALSPALDPCASTSAQSSCRAEGAEVVCSCRGPVVAVSDASSILRALPIYTFAYTCHQNIVSISNEMTLVGRPAPERVIRVIQGALPFALAVYLSVAVAGYSTFGNRVAHDVLTSYPNSPLVSGARILVAVLVMFSYPLQSHPGCTCALSVASATAAALERRRRQRSGPRTISTISSSQANVATPDGSSSRKGSSDNLARCRQWPCFVNGSSEDHTGLPLPPLAESDIARALATTLFLAVTTSTAMALDDLGIMLSLVGATGSVVVTYLLPGFCYYRLCRQPRSWMRRAALLQTLLGAILMPVSLALIMTKK